MKPWNRIVAHVSAHLPDGIEARRTLIEALHGVIPESEPVRHQVGGMLEVLDMHMASQRELAFGVFAMFPETSATRGSGRLGDRRLARGSARLADKQVQR